MAKNNIKKVKHPLLRNIKKYPWLYLMFLPVVVFYVLFCYFPMYGVVIAFQDFSPARGFFNSDWVGFEHFRDFFTDVNFFRVVRNTLVINLELLVFGFPLPIIFALLLNEINRKSFKRITQTITYMPHFISSVVVCGLMIDFVKSGGLITSALGLFGVENSNLLTKSEWFQPLYVSMNIWQELGWDSIIYFAALSGIDPTLYEAADVDGASKFKKIIHITLPGIASTIVILLILRIGNLMSLSWDRIFLLYNELIYETSDVISTYVYRRGLIQFEYSYGAAVGLFNSLINVVLLWGANRFSRKINDTSLW